MQSHAISNGYIVKVEEESGDNDEAARSDYVSGLSDIEMASLNDALSNRRLSQKSEIS